ncbi:MAG: M48 family peptidase [Calditrichaeota bacterium]|nr:MAG: M48 family peptidase [Calditrichota bacterium]
MMGGKSSSIGENVIREVEGIGRVTFRRSPRARRVSIRVAPHSGVLVVVPRGVSLAQAQALAVSRAGWIARALQKVRALEKPRVLYDGTTPLRTRRHVLEVKAGGVERVEARIAAGVITVCHPEGLALTDPEVQEAIWSGLVAAWRTEAKALLPPRVALLARRHGFRYRRVFIKNHRSRWGSCSAANNLNLSLHLMQLPDELIDYVILHELVHTEIKNHSPAFWRRLTEVCPRASHLRQELKKRASAVLRWD